jgi:hypothetical protein
MKLNKCEGCCFSELDDSGLFEVCTLGGDCNEKD